MENDSRITTEKAPQTWTKEQQEAIVLVSDIIHQHFGSFVFIAIPPFNEDEVDRKKGIRVETAMSTKGMPGDLGVMLFTYLNKYPSVAKNMGLNILQCDSEIQEFMRQCNYK